MERARLVILVFLASCAASADDAGMRAAPAQAISPFAGFCVDTQPDRWHSQSIAQRTTGVATIQFTATLYDESRAPVDAIVGLSDQVADDFRDLGPIVRFNPDGVIDVRNGDRYTADIVMPYVVSSPFDDPVIQYFVRMVVDMDAHRYSVFVREQDGPERQLANNYAFRTEQAELSRIGNVAAFMDSSHGAAFFCSGKVTPPVCASSSATSGWHTTATYPEPGTSSYIVEVDVVPQGSNIDAIVGLASDAPSTYGDLAAIVRFNRDGLVDARDGDLYRAAQRVTYTANHPYTFVYIVDLASGTYSAWLDDPSGNASFGVADHFAFRTEQAGATSLGVIGQKVDVGSANVCDVAVWPL